MLNTEDFIKRLEYLMDYYSLNASLFADKIGVQRSSISHLLSGRNKPSLDFILKISDEFPDVDLYWLIHGAANFLKNNAPTPMPENIKKESAQDLFSANIPKNESATIEPFLQPANEKSADKAIFKIVVLYQDGSFRDFKPCD